MPGRRLSSVRHVPGAAVGVAGVVALSAAALFVGASASLANTGAGDAADLASGATAHRDLLSGTYSGAGLTLATDAAGRVAVGRVTAGSPAAAAGLRVGDVVVRVADADVSRSPASQVAGLLRGTTDSQVSILVRRGEADVDVALTRTGVTSRSVHVRDLGDRTRVIRIDRFSADAAASVKQAVLEAPRARGLVLDLRMNPGGRVDQAVAVAGLFLDAGPMATVAYVAADDGRTNSLSLRTTGAAITDLPLVVLVDGGSASAAEMLTGALQDRGRAVVAGARTFGKGTVHIFNAPLRGGVQGGSLTTSTNLATSSTLATYTTPHGHEVDGQGLLPDVLLNDPVSDADAFAAALAILAGSA